MDDRRCFGQAEFAAVRGDKEPLEVVRETG